MDYYEELGLRPSATEDDIHKAFRTITKILHPDLQTDPATRDAAALQMRRLNVIMDVLLDPKRRHEYDRTLRGGSVVPAAVPAHAPPPYLRSEGLSLPGRWLRVPGVGVALTIVAGVLLTLGVVWFQAGDLIHFETPADRSVTVQQSPAHTPEARPESPERTPPARPDTRRARAATQDAPVAPLVPTGAQTRSATVAEIPPLSPTNATAQPRAAERPAEVATPLPAAPPPRIPAPAPALASPATPSPAPSSGLEGLWVYAPEALPGTRSPALYAPEYIQLRIRARNDMLYGEYAARYFVSDRPISADVSFAFQGKLSESGSLGWDAADGSLGIVNLRLTGPQSLQVNWRVTSFGSRIGLGAGTAVLIRKLQP